MAAASSARADDSFLALDVVGFMKLRDELAVARRLPGLPPPGAGFLPVVELLDMRRVAVLVLTGPTAAEGSRWRSLADTLSKGHGETGAGSDF